MENLVYLCIDAGGTKTKGCLFSLDGNVVAECVTGPGSPAADPDSCWDNITCAIDKLIKENPLLKVCFIQMGVSGAGVVPNLKSIEKGFSDKYRVPCSIQNDAIEGLYSIIQDKYKSGILVLAGTGSAVYGIKDKVTFLIGGWGHIICERGSAYACCHQASLRVIDKYENKMTLSDFDKLWMKHLGIDTVNDFKKVFYGSPKDVIAKNVIYIKQLANDGNLDARDILLEEGKALGEQVHKLAVQLDLTDDAVIGLRGSFILKDAIFVQQGLFSYLDNLNYHFKYIEKEEDPIVGSFYMAKERSIVC